MHSLSARGIYVLLVIALILLVVASLAWPELHTAPAQAPVPTIGEAIRTGMVPPLPLSTTTAAQLATSKGFQVLVSVTDRGFEPAQVNIHAGETVRFTNNSSGSVAVALGLGAVRPVCTGAVSDSCSPILAPREFWEATLSGAGTWHTEIVGNSQNSGVVQVR